ncbi:MAG: FAD/FMN-containing dehydrogenase [Myxococcales bacterium]|nr:FAD/FMN-containing dehydrogenase [Myxococcales bacterium]
MPSAPGSAEPMLDRATEDRHAAKVARIVGQLRANRGTTPISLHKASVSHQVPKAGDLRRTDDKIDISDLTEVLLVDPVNQVCIAESGVTFVDLVTATLAHGLVPIVVPELETITIGGAVAGCSIESMSFVHGGFHDTCLSYDVITAAGDVLTCTPENDHSLVFQMVHGAQLLFRDRVLDPVQQTELRRGQIDHGSDEQVPRRLHEDVQGGDGSQLNHRRRRSRAVSETIAA